MSRVQNRFIGRQRELEDLTAGLDQTRRGVGGLYVVVGEAGIGKTWLATEVARIAQGRGFLVAWGRSWEAPGAPPFWPWIQALRTLLRAAERATPDEPRGETLSRPLAALRGEDADAPAVEPTQARFALFDAVQAALREIATADRPIAVLFEDLHAADPSSLALLHAVARELCDTHVFVLATYREQDLRAEPDRAELVHRIAREAAYVPLRRFDKTEIEAALRRHLGDAALEDVVERVRHATEGNPLFVEEVARALADTPARSGSADLPIPPGVRDAIRTHLARLDPAAREVVEAASVIANDLDVELLAAATSQSVDACKRALDHAVATAALVESGPDTYAFAHALVRDVVYRDLRSDRRALLHAAAARVLVTLRSPDRAAAEVAGHLLAAVETVGAQRAFEGAIAAARAAMQALAFEDVVVIVEKTLEALPPASISARDRATALSLLGEAKIRSGDRAAGKFACLEAAAIARTLADPDLLAGAALAYGAEIQIASVDPRFVELLLDTLRALPEANLAMRARISARLAAAEQPAPDPTKPMARAHEAIALARSSGDRDALRGVLFFAGSALVEFADPRERMPVNREMLTLAVEARDASQTFRAYLRLLWDHLELGDNAAAAETACEVERVARELARPVHLATAMLVRAAMAAQRGAFAEADALARSAERHSAATGPLLLQRFARALLQDDVGTLRASLPRIEPELESIPGGALYAALMRAMVRSREGDLVGARAAFDSVDLSQGFVRFDPSALRNAAEVCAELGETARARDLVPALRAMSNRFFAWGQSGMAVEGPVTGLLGRLLAITGEWEQAFEAFADAEARAKAAGALAPLAWIFLWHAQARAAHGEPTIELELRARASALARELGMTQFLERIERAPTSIAEANEEERSTPAFRLAREGEMWCVTTAAGAFRLRDSRGLRMLAHLVSEPDREVHVLLLAGEGEDAGHAGDLGDAGEILDATAVRAYKGRLEDLRERIEEADAHGDSPRARKLRDELDFLVRELAGGVGLRGRRRKAAAAAERARVNVQRRLRDAIRRIGEHAPTLGEYLGWTVRTGTFCAYRPARNTPRRT